MNRGEKIKQKRLALGLSLRGLEKETGISNSFLCLIEKYNVNFSSNKIIKLSKALKLSTEEILDLETYEETQEIKKDKEITLPIKWNISNNITTKFSDHFVIQPINNNFRLSFFETNPEININNNKEKGFIECNCISKIVIEKEDMLKLKKLIEKYL